MAAKYVEGCYEIIKCHRVRIRAVKAPIKVTGYVRIRV